jgi:hypothetical protein
MKPYNPLEKENLGRSVTHSLINSEPIPLGAIQRFAGAGVYAIYYLGDFDPYVPLRNWNQAPPDLHLPIYVGKAVPTGGRKGSVNTENSAKGSALFRRLDEHRKSVADVTNLSVSDFWCRFLVVDDIWIPLGESLLIHVYRPLWNSVVDGFGNHDPGSGRYRGARSSWDTLHPGRHWVENCATSKSSEPDILLRIRQFWDSYEGPAILD